MDEEISDELGQSLALDGNAVAGELRALFGFEMTSNPATCAHCGHETEMGGTIAYVGAGIILRCPTCHEIMVRIVATPRGTWLDARGTALLLLPTSR